MWFSNGPGRATWLVPLSVGIGLLCGPQGQTGTAAKESVKGTVRAERTPVGNFTFEVNDCAPGGALSPPFKGVELYGPKRSLLRVLDHGALGELRLYPQGASEGAIAITKKECGERFDIFLKWAPIGQPDTIDGRVHVTCWAGSGKLVADVDFTSCQGARPPT